MVNATEETGHLPDFHAVDAETLDRTVAVYICSPANPQGAVATARVLGRPDSFGRKA